MKRTSEVKSEPSGVVWTRTLLSELPVPEREFIVNGPTHRKIGALAAGIRRLGTTREKDRNFLCLCSENKTLVAAALLAALSGGPRLVFPYAFSRQAVADVLKTMPVSRVLADGPGDFPPEVETIFPDMLDQADLQPRHFIDADDPFLMLFTGGSTGAPKVWAKTPRNMIEEARYMCTTFGITAEDVFLATVPPQHIYGLLFSVLVPLIASARVLEGIYVFPREILKAAAESGATILVSVPACYRVMKRDFLKRHHLRMAFSSAGALDAADADYFRAKTDLDINEIYGSTETGGVAVRCRGRDGDTLTALDPVEWRIEDGRLQVRSPFISPSLPRNEAGFFVTADRAEKDGQGRFFLRGRADDVVKIGGKRVDLVEIQEKIRKIDGVRDALAVLLPREKGRPTDLAALVVTEVDPAELRRELGAMVEPYAVPRRFVAVDRIPMTATGKVDRAAIHEILKSGKS
ncbi:MAG TPA: class I adenylate-forming enzyme family protein [Syntrophales bacterium]|nr:class I adenylate-forming enzyme family protein [Syntrophales bacterium]